MSDELPPFGQQSGPDIKRLILTAVIMSVLIIVFNHFILPTPQKAPEQSAPAQQAQVAAKTEQPKTPPVVEAPVVADANVQPTPETVALVRTPIKVDVTNAAVESDAAWSKGGYELVADNAGAKIANVALFGYRDPVELIKGPHATFYGLRSRSSGTPVTEDAAYEIVKAEPHEIVYQRTTAAGLKLTRRYTFATDNYLVRHAIEVENTSQHALKVDLDLVFKTDAIAEESSFLAPAQNELNFIASQNGDLTRHGHSDVLKETQKVSGGVDFVGFEQRYFLVSMLPQNPSDVLEVSAKGTYTDQSKHQFDADMVVSLKSKELAAGAVAKWEMDAYAGPKQLSLLKGVGHGLDQTINFGWFGVISRPLLWVMVTIFGFVKNFGIAIILLTLLIKLLTFPLTQKSFVSMEAMKKIGPDIKALEKKYGHDRTTLSQKQMELYRERGVNPMAGCLPMLLQFPIWIALYQMLGNSIEIYQKPFMGWLTDLTAPDPLYILPILMGISMVVQQLMQPVQDDQKAMKYAMLATSVVFTFIMLKLPSGLSLYMFTNNILTLGQQFVIKRRFQVRTA